MALVIDIANAVVDSLNGATFNPTFTAAMAKTPRFKLPELTTLRVTVVPKSREVSMLTRGLNNNEYAIDIGVHKKVGSDTEVDEMLDLVEQITDHLNRRDMASASWLGIGNEPIYDPKMLLEDSVFFSLVTVRYRKSR